MSRRPLLSRRIAVSGSVLLCVLAVTALAEPQQQQPLTAERMAATPNAPASASLPPASSPFPTASASQPSSAAPARAEVGDATRALLRMQAGGTYAAPARPMLGDQASLAYQRYLDSFKHPIPERFNFNLQQSQHGQEP